MADSLMIDKTAENSVYGASERLMNREEVAAYLQTTCRKIGLYTKYGLIKSIRIGRNFMYRPEWVMQFLEDWVDYDLRDESKVIAAIGLKKREDKE